MARKALLVGINDYQSINDLRGCLNDVTNMRDVLKSLLGFTNADISVLTDTRATKNNILARLNWMVNGARPGDYLVYSLFYGCQGMFHRNHHQKYLKIILMM